MPKDLSHLSDNEIETLIDTYFESDDIVRIIKEENNYKKIFIIIFVAIVGLFIFRKKK